SSVSRCPVCCPDRAVFLSLFLRPPRVLSAVVGRGACTPRCAILAWPCQWPRCPMVILQLSHACSTCEARGPDDPRRQPTLQSFVSAGASQSQLLGEALGRWIWLCLRAAFGVVELALLLVTGSIMPPL